MKKYKIFVNAFFVVFLVACHSDKQPAVASKPDNLTAAMPAAFLDQAKLAKLMVESGIAEPERSLVHVSHVCNLTIDQQEYTVVDMRELIKGAQVPRGVNQIIVLNSGQQLVQRIEYGQARPLFCEENKLYLYDKLALDGSATEGNVLLFEDSGFKVSTSQEDINSLLPLKK